MANEKKIAKYQKLFLSWLEDAVTVEEQLENESDPKKVDKLQKKFKKNKDMVLHNGKIMSGGRHYTEYLGTVDRTTAADCTGVIPVWYSGR